MRRRRKKNFLRRLSLPKMPELDLEPETKRSILVVFLITIGALGLLSLFDLAGLLGKYIFHFLLIFFGFGRWIIPIILLVWGFLLYDEERYEIRGSNYLGLFLFVLSFHSLLQLFVDQDQWEILLNQGIGGGKLGILVAGVFIKIMGFWASLLVTFAIFLISLILMFNTSLSTLIGRESFIAKLFFPLIFLLRKLFHKREVEVEEVEEEEEEEIEEENEEEEEEEDEEEEEEEEKEEEEESESDKEKGDKEEDQEEIEEENDFKIRNIKEEAVISVTAKDTEGLGMEYWQPTNIKINFPLTLLKDSKSKPTSGDIERNIKIIKDTLEKFGIPVEMGEVNVGPTVTQYTFKPAEGIKLSRITNLNNDLALALAAHPIRIEAPIPGKSLVGIEVPNKSTALVSLREILSSREFKERKSNLMVALGKDVSGKVWLYDIAKMPHLLVAGATNSGKSVCLNSIIISLMYQNNPDDLRFIMVDPKRVELTIYNDIPYLLTPVVTDVGKTINALKWCLNEMERRLNLLSKYKKKTIDGFNASINPKKSGINKLPYIIFIIDELADLMLTNARDIEAIITRLIQMSRAVGIHLILATQRPSVDVITGLIKANIPTRIAFAVTSGTDSRTILDCLGAEKLLGKGDMLFSSVDTSKPIRLQGAFVSETEIKKVVRYAKEKGQASYVDEVTERQQVKGLGGVGLDGNKGDEDELLEEAKEAIIKAGKASASFLQRKLRIGYARAASILDTLEEMGIVGPANGSKPREVLITPEQYEAMEMSVSNVSLHNREEAVAPDSYLDSDEEVTGVPPALKPQTEKDSGEDEESNNNEENQEEENIEENMEIEDEKEKEDKQQEEDKKDKRDKKEQTSKDNIKDNTENKEEDDKEEDEEEEDDDEDWKYYAK